MRALAAAIAKRVDGCRDAVRRGHPRRRLGGRRPRRNLRSGEGELLLDRLEPADRATELHPLPRVAHGAGQRTAGRPGEQLGAAERSP